MLFNNINIILQSEGGGGKKGLSTIIFIMQPLQIGYTIEFKFRADIVFQTKAFLWNRIQPYFTEPIGNAPNPTARRGLEKSISSHHQTTDVEFEFGQNINMKIFYKHFILHQSTFVSINIMMQNILPVQTESVSETWPPNLSTQYLAWHTISQIEFRTKLN